MRRRAPSRRDRRALIVGGLVFAGLLSARFGLQPYIRTVRSLEREIVHQRQTVRRELEIVRAASEYPRLLERTVADIVAFDARLLDASTPSAARNRLVRLVERRLGEQPIRVLRLRPQEPKILGRGLTSVSVHVEAESDLEGLLMVLASVEADPMMLEVDQVDVRVVDRGAAGGRGTAPPEVLTFGFIVSGFAWSGDAAAARDGQAVQSADRPRPMHRGQPGPSSRARSP